MSLISSMVNGFIGLRAEMGGAPAPWSDFWYGPAAQSASSGMRVSPDTVKRLGTVVAAVSAKARAMGTLPCFLYTDAPGNDGHMLAKKHPYFNLLHKRPNSIQTAFDFYEMMQGHLELRGNAYAELMTDSHGVIGEMVPMHPDRVTIEQLRNGMLRYRYNDPLTGNTRYLLQDEVFHLREWADIAQAGQSRIAMGVDVLGNALAQQDYVGRYLKNDASAGIFVVGTNFADKASERKYIDAFQESGTGENRHRVRLLPPGVDIKSISVKPTDMQLLESIKASDAKICSLFNVLPHLIGVDSGKAATYASVEQFNLMHVQQCVLPMAVRWEQALERQVVEDDRFYIKFSLAALLRGDFATRMQGYAVAIEHGWLSQDDVRELEDLNPIAGGIGKKYWRALNWTTLDALPAAAQQARAQQQPDPSDDSAEDEGIAEEPDEASAEARRQQLHILALDAGGRSVRRETRAMRRLLEQTEASGDFNAALDSLGVLLRDSWTFTCSALHLDANAQITAHSWSDARGMQYRAALLSEDLQAAEGFVADYELAGAKQLAELAVKGVA